MINAQPFFEGIKNVDAESIASVRALADTILILTAQNILESLTSWFTGGTSLTKFGEDIVTFAPYYKQYAEIVKGVDGRVVSDSANSAKALSELANNLPNQGGVVSWFVGDNTLDKFGEKLPSFGKDLKKYSDNVSGVNNNVVENSAKSAKALAELAKNLPNQGGLLSWLIGDNTLDKFGEPLPKFGKDLKSYADNVSGLDSNVVTNSANSAKALSELANNLPNQGGIVSWFTGDNKISDFGEDLAKFGKAFKEYYEYIRDISVVQVNSISSAIGSLVNQLITIKNNNLGETAKNFGSNIKDMGKDIKKGLNDNIEVNYWDYYNIGKNVGQGLIDGMNSKSWSISETARRIGRDIVKKFREELDIRSPSHVMEALAEFVPLGIVKGINNKSSLVYESMTNLVSGMTVNPDDFKIDTTQFIDYGTISGNIATQSDINMNDNIVNKIGQACYNAFVNAMRTQGIRANINVKPDKDGIFKAVQAGAESYAIQTGESPFPVLA